MNPARRGTPESEAVASSEDERPWPSSTAFGKFPLKENSVPGLGGGIWSTQKRGSFKLSEAAAAAQRNAAREGRLSAANATHAGLRGTPSPATTEGASNLPFAIPLQPTPKTGRSLSHSQGQREVSQGSAVQPSVGGHPQALPLGLLAEEDADTESESDVGSRLTHTSSHPPMGSLMRTSTLPAAYEHYGNGREYVDNYSSPPPQPGLSRGRTFESAFANMSLDAPRQRTHWQSHLGWDDVPTVNESRRHSLADIPTRRGSLAGGEPSHLNRSFTVEHAIEDDTTQYPSLPSDRTTDVDSGENAAARIQEAFEANQIPEMYRAGYQTLDPRQRQVLEERRRQQAALNPGVQYQNMARPKKELYIVSFKCSRVDVFFLLSNTGLRLKEGDMVIVEADRGQDLGCVQHARVSPEAARLLKKKYTEEQYKWLMMFSRNKHSGTNPNAQEFEEEEEETEPFDPVVFPNAPMEMQGNIPKETYQNLKPKAIKRLAKPMEIGMLFAKEGSEAKAKRTCQHKAAQLRLQMEILDCEWQWDFQKLIFYYYADHYINFKDLVVEMYRIYKIRVWMSAINPASFSQHANQPPSGIGPGAVAPYNPWAGNNTYTMTYGEDPDPYGAQMPYQIPYDTYNPSYPAIPGITNSFAPPNFANGQNAMYFGGAGAPTHANMGQPSRLPDAASINQPVDYNQNNGFYAHANNTGSPYASNDVEFMAPLNHMSIAEGPEHGGPGATSGQHAMGSWLHQQHGARPARGMPRPAVLPNPIGTSRPISQGNEFGNGQATPRNWDFVGPNIAQSPRRWDFVGPNTHRAPMRDSAGPTNHDNRASHSSTTGTAANTRLEDEAAGRGQTLTRYLSELPPPDAMRAEEYEDLAKLARVR